jgi:hypothetical protein
MVFLTDLGLKLGQMVRNTKDSGTKVECMEMGSLYLRRVRALLVSSDMACLGVLVFESGKMVITMKESTVRATSRGQDFSLARNKGGNMMVNGLVVK